MVQPIKKPIMRGLVKAHIIKSFIITMFTICSLGASYKYFVMDPRKKAYHDFYLDYNAEEEADRLYKMGLIRGWHDNEDPPEHKFKIPY